MTEPTDTVDLIGVRVNGEHVNLGKVTMPPRMKAREIARSYFGHFDDEDGSDAELCFGALETFLDWLVKHGWHDTPQPTQAQAGAVPTREFLERTLAAMEGVIDVADRKTDEFDALRSCVIDLTLMLFKPEQHHGIKGGQHGL